MRLSFKPNVTCRPTRNLWFVNVFSTFRRQNSVLKNGSWSRAPLAAGAPSRGTTGTMVNPALTTLTYLFSAILLAQPAKITKPLNTYI